MGDLPLAVLPSPLGVLVRRAIALSMAPLRSVADKLKGGVAAPLDMLGKTALNETSFRALRFGAPWRSTHHS
jgi:hypothetical protein